MAAEPVTINHFLGQDQVKKRFQVALEASWNDGERLPHMLMIGPPGTGKTLLAHLAGREMGVPVHERLAQVLINSGSLNGLLMSAKHKEIVFLDEVHELAPELQTLLYRAMEGGRISVRGRDNSTLTIPIADLTMLAATTDEYRLLGPLRDRFKLVLPFSFYEVEPLAVITGQRARMMGIEMDDAVARQIAQRAKGTPRLALRLLEACHRYARSVGDTRVSMRHFEGTVVLEGIDTLGLGPDAQRYLKCLAERTAGTTRLFTLEAALGIHQRTIQTVIEPYLIRAGLVERRPSGRAITEAGLRHLGLLSEPRISAA